MTKSETVRSRVESSVKEQALAVVAPLGLTISDAIRMFLIRVAAQKAIPFDMNRKPGAKGDDDATRWVLAATSGSTGADAPSTS